VRRTLVCVLLGAALAGCGRSRETPTADARTSVPLTAEQRDAVLIEMRTMLGSVDGVLNGVARWDTAAIRGAALRSGTAAAADPALEKILPAPWLEMAERTHGGFDALGAAVARGVPRDTVLAKLATITPACMNCHAMYRLPSR